MAGGDETDNNQDSEIQDRKLVCMVGNTRRVTLCRNSVHVLDAMDIYRTDPPNLPVPIVIKPRCMSSFCDHFDLLVNKVKLKDLPLQILCDHVLLS